MVAKKVSHSQMIKNRIKAC